MPPRDAFWSLATREIPPRPLRLKSARSLRERLFGPSVAGSGIPPYPHPQLGGAPSDWVTPELPKYGGPAVWVLLTIVSHELHKDEASESREVFFLSFGLFSARVLSLCSRMFLRLLVQFCLEPPGPARRLMCPWRLGRFPLILTLSIFRACFCTMLPEGFPTNLGGSPASAGA